MLDRFSRQRSVLRRPPSALPCQFPPHRPRAQAQANSATATALRTPPDEPDLQGISIDETEAPFNASH